MLVYIWLIEEWIEPNSLFLITGQDRNGQNAHILTSKSMVSGSQVPFKQSMSIQVSRGYVKCTRANSGSLTDLGECLVYLKIHPSRHISGKQTLGGGSAVAGYKWRKDGVGSTGKRKVLRFKERLEPNRDNELLLIILISIQIEILPH